jgi:hydrogenase maturation protease
MTKKTIILGMGNTILTDDGAGIYVVRMIKKIVDHDSKSVTIKETSLGGFNFIDLLAGFDRAVIIDAIHTKGGTPGEFYELDPKALKPSSRLSSLHGIDFATACEMAVQMDVSFPSEIKIFVIEVQDEFTFGEACTPQVTEALPRMAESITQELMKSGWL